MATNERDWFLDQASRTQKVFEITAILAFIEGKDAEDRGLRDLAVRFEDQIYKSALSVGNYNTRINTKLSKVQRLRNQRVRSPERVTSDSGWFLNQAARAQKVREITATLGNIEGRGTEARILHDLAKKFENRIYKGSRSRNNYNTRINTKLSKVLRIRQLQRMINSSRMEVPQ